MLFADEFAEVYECVTHAAKCCVDAHASLFCYLLEGKIVVEAQEDNLFLGLRQVIEQTTDAFAALSVDDFVFPSCLAQLQAVECFGLYEVFANGASCLALAALIYNEIVRDTRKPSTELAARLVLVTANGNDGTLERVLKEVVGNFAILY